MLRTWQFYAPGVPVHRLGAVGAAGDRQRDADAEPDGRHARLLRRQRLAAGVVRRPGQRGRPGRHRPVFRPDRPGQRLPDQRHRVGGLPVPDADGHGLGERAAAVPGRRRGVLAVRRRAGADAGVDGRLLRLEEPRASTTAWCSSAGASRSSCRSWPATSRTRPGAWTTRSTSPAGLLAAAVLVSRLLSRPTAPPRDPKGPPRPERIRRGSDAVGKARPRTKPFRRRSIRPASRPSPGAPSSTPTPDARRSFLDAEVGDAAEVLARLDGLSAAFDGLEGAGGISRPTAASGRSPATISRAAGRPRAVGTGSGWRPGGSKQLHSPALPGSATDIPRITVGGASVRVGPRSGSGCGATARCAQEDRLWCSAYGASQHGETMPSRDCS